MEKANRRRSEAAFRGEEDRLPPPIQGGGLARCKIGDRHCARNLGTFVSQITSKRKRMKEKRQEEQRLLDFGLLMKTRLFSFTGLEEENVTIVMSSTPLLRSFAYLLRKGIFLYFLQDVKPRSDRHGHLPAAYATSIFVFFQVSVCSSLPTCVLESTTLRAWEWRRYTIEWNGAVYKLVMHMGWLIAKDDKWQLFETAYQQRAGRRAISAINQRREQEAREQVARRSRDRGPAIIRSQ